MSEEILDYIKSSFELKNQGYYKPAIEMLYKALAIENDNIEILAQLAQLYNLLDNKQRALHYVGKVLDINSNHLDCIILKKNIYIEQGKIKEAEELAERIYQITSTDEALAEELSLLTQLKEFERVESFENEIEHHSDIVLYELGKAKLLNNKTDKAIELFKIGYNKNKLNENILFNLGKIYYENKNFSEAKNMFSELKDIKPSGEVMNYLGLFKLEEGSYSKAIEYFNKAKEFDDKNSEYLYNLASAYFLQGWFKEAETVFKLTISINPNVEKYHHSLAYLYYQTERYDMALFELDSVNKDNNENEFAKVVRAMIIAKQGDLIGAKDSLENFITAYPLNDFAFESLSKIYKELSQYKEAKDSIEHALVIKPDSLIYLSELVELNIILKEYDEAKIHIEKLIDINENFVTAYTASAKINYLQEDFSSLYDNAQNIIELDENSPQGYFYNAVALFEQGDINFAFESMKKAISLDALNAELYIKMSEFYQKTGDIKTAFLWAKEAADIENKSYQYKWLCAKLAIEVKDEKEALHYYSLAFRLGGFDEALASEYSIYLDSLGKHKQAKAIRTVSKKNLLTT